jgi:FMN-dependent NADH-azoreductase
MKIMHVDASAKRERSHSRALARYFSSVCAKSASSSTSTIST